MPTGDQTFWQEIAKFLWLLLGVPMMWMWKKVTNSVAKEELLAATNEARNDRGEIKVMIRDLYNAAERDRVTVRDGFKEVTKAVTDMRADLVDRINKK